MRLVFPIFKKRDKTECPNYRGVTLLNVVYKIFSTIWARKLSPYSKEIWGEYQCGFRASRSTIEQEFLLRQSLKKGYKCSIDVHMLLINYKQSFGCVN
jgi:hypothetical protein